VPYDLQTIRAPRLAGAALSAAPALLENSFTKAAAIPKMLRDTGLEAYRGRAVHEVPTVAPRLPRSTLTAGALPPVDLAAMMAAAWPAARGFGFATAADFVRAYREKKTSPEQVARALLDAMKKFDAMSPPLRAIIASREADVLAQARASAERWARGEPLGVLDGVPVAVKDELDQLGYPTTAGTKFLNTVATADAVVVARLRAQGALLFGKANMHEIGIDTTGFNPHHGTPRNPYDAVCYTGGSSSGSAAAVGAGLCPIAVGADGGGSIRIPAALCGVVGLKATFSRVPETGAFPLCWSVGHVGPIAATVHDAALAYAVMAGADAGDPNSVGQPGVTLQGFELGGEVASLEGLRLGIYAEWFEDADPEVVKGCRAAVAALEARGARVVPVEVPELESARLAHAISILSEMGTSMDEYEAHRGEMALTSRLLLAMAREMTARDYVKAQQIRTRMTNHMDRVFTQCDALVTPTTARVAPRIGNDVLPRGESDLDLTSAMMRYVFLANLTGHPALTVPCGYDSRGLPIGLQLTGRAWEESLLLRLGRAVEAGTERRAPERYAKLLG
jgi:Asp-tRNA(Asn)/Glu-tRNA(Gln) amidotransferase A subunit family amidase